MAEFASWGRWYRLVIVLTVSVGVAFGSTNAVRAFARNYLPLSDGELSRRVRQRPIAIAFKPGAHAKLGGVSIRLKDHNLLVISGVDASGKPWTCYAQWNNYGGAFYMADLDRDGTEDLIYVSNTGGNGLAPPTHLLTLLFDTSGRPVASEMDGYFDYDAKGVKDLIDLNNDGRAELVRQSFDDGYWVTSLYEAKGARWVRVQGPYGDRSYPLYTRFTNRPNRTSTVPSRGRHPREDDLSNNSIAPNRNLKLMEVKWGDVAYSENPELTLSNGQRCTLNAWQSTAAFVLDSVSGRRIAILSAADQAQQMVAEMKQKSMSISVSGKRRVHGGDSCVPELIWAWETQATPPGVHVRESDDASNGLTALAKQRQFWQEQAFYCLSTPDKFPAKKDDPYDPLKRYDSSVSKND